MRRFLFAKVLFARKLLWEEEVNEDSVLDELSNEQLIGIYYLSAAVSYPLCDNLMFQADDDAVIDTLAAELRGLLDSADTQTAYLVFQFLMAICCLRIPPEIQMLQYYEPSLEQFMRELLLDIEDYREQLELCEPCDLFDLCDEDEMEFC